MGVQQLWFGRRAGTPPRECARSSWLQFMMRLRVDTALIVHDERAEDADARLERYSEWDVVEYAEARGQ